MATTRCLTFTEYHNPLFPVVGDSHSHPVHRLETSSGLILAAMSQLTSSVTTHVLLSDIFVDLFMFSIHIGVVFTHESNT